MTTQEAFELLISKKGWYKKCFIDASTAYSYVSRFKKGNLTTKKIEEILNKAGWEKVPEVWFQPTKR